MNFSKLGKQAALWTCFATACGAVSQQTTQLPAKPQASPSSSRPQVLFSRSSQDANSTAGANPAAGKPSTPVTNAERQALTFTAYDLNIHLVPRDLSLSVQARMSVRNDGTAPLSQVALQLSSSLHFEQISSAGHKLGFTQAALNSDTDHTGQLDEATVQLPQPLAPGAALELECAYSGTVPVTGKRLEALGAPGDTAESSDWDRISEDFVGLRGFGNVVWYPVSSVPATLGDGNKVFGEIGRQKLRASNATVGMHVTVEFADQPPTVAVLDGHLFPLGAPDSMPSGIFPGVIQVSLPPGRLGFNTPSLILARQTASHQGPLTVFTRDSDTENAQSFLTASTLTAPLLQQWLGKQVKQDPAVVDLPEPDDASAEEGATLLTPVVAAQPESLATGMTDALSHAYFVSPRAWLNEGVPEFMTSLWTEQSSGRTAALEHLESERAALALAEPASPGAGDGEPLIDAADPVYYRTKAAYVLWMLRDIAGDAALQKALQAYDPSLDHTPGYFEQLLEKASGKDLHWFFDSWVNHDRGLPDLEITHVYPSAANLGETLVAIDITNHGYAACEVPVTVRSGTAAAITDRVRVPAHGVVTHRMEIAGQPTEVQVNDGSVPEVAATVHVTKLQ